jgi:folate-binding protein YgfZ
MLAGGVALSTGEVERERIAAGIPAVPMDLGLADLPNEGGLETEAISYTKGCYLGQEVMARLKAMGQVRRRLRRVRGTGEPPPRPTALYQAARKLGELRSAARDGADWIGLAMLSLGSLQRDEGLALAADGAPVVRLADEP